MSLCKSALLVGMTAGLFGVTPVLWGQEQPIVEVPNAKNSVQGEINAAGVNVRSGPADSYYPTGQLNKGDRITVVGHRFEWLKIVPPAGSFSCVAKIYVDRDGTSNKGKVNRDDVLVRAGSDLTAQRSQAQTKLGRGDSVQIIGEMDEYYKIEPPAGAYVYVAKKFVDQVGANAAGPAVAAVAAGAAAAPDAAAAAGAAAAQAGNGAAVELEPAAPHETSMESAPVSGPTTRKAEKAHKPAKAVAGGAAVKSSKSEETVAAAIPEPDAELEAEFRKLEARFEQAKGQPLEDQPVAEMLGGYTQLQDNPKLSSTSRRMSAYRVKYLTVVQKQQQELVKAKQEASDFSAQQAQLETQRKESEERVKAAGIAVYQAVGQLEASSVQKEGQALLRLVDPADGRTLIYIVTNDPTQRGMVGKFVGVRGEVAKDTALSVDFIEPMELEQVDPARVFKGVTAKIYPPSALRNSTANQ